MITTRKATGPPCSSCGELLDRHRLCGNCGKEALCGCGCGGRVAGRPNKLYVNSRHRDRHHNRRRAALTIRPNEGAPLIVRDVAKIPEPEFRRLLAEACRRRWPEGRGKGSDRWRLRVRFKGDR